jgi:DDE family transposase
LLLGETDRAIRLTKRFAACFIDAPVPELVEHEIGTMVLQRVVGIALGYEEVDDHDELRHDPVLAVIAGKLVAKRADCAPLASKSTLNRVELSRPEPSRYHKVSHDPAAIEMLFDDLFVEAHRRAPAQIILDLDARPNLATDLRSPVLAVPTPVRPTRRSGGADDGDRPYDGGDEQAKGLDGFLANRIFG